MDTQEINYSFKFLSRDSGESNQGKIVAVMKSCHQGHLVGKKNELCVIALSLAKDVGYTDFDAE